MDWPPGRYRLAGEREPAFIVFPGKVFPRLTPRLFIRPIVERRLTLSWARILSGSVLKVIEPSAARRSSRISLTTSPNLLRPFL
jgi:hypothetical protein